MERDHIHQLTQLGLNVYEAKAYTALLGKDSFSATQVADLSGVPRQRIYDILASLVERGLAISRPGRQGTRYAAIAPKLALSALIEQEQLRLTRLQTVAGTLSDELSRQYQEGKAESSPLEYIEVLRGRTAISQRFAAIQSNCKREILIFTKPPYALQPQDNLAGLDMLQRDVQARSMYEYDVLRNDETRQAIDYFIQHGENARFVEHLPLKLVIVDEELVMCALEDPIAGRTDLTIMVIEHKQLAQMVKLAFEALWSRGATFAEATEQMDITPPTASPA